MSTLVVYKSSTGFTKQYAQWIAEELNCKAITIKELTDQGVTEKDTVIFGGWIMGNTIVGYDKIKELNIQNLILFAVGASLKGRETTEEIVAVNNLGDISFFYMPGGIRFDKLNFFVKIMLKLIKKSIAQKEEKTERDVYMERVICSNFDISDRKNIEELTEYIKECEKRKS